MRAGEGEGEGEVKGEGEVVRVRAKFGIYAHWGPYSVPAYQNEW